MNYPLVLPGGETIPGSSPVVVIGPNGSGKSRQTRLITCPTASIEFVNALRNTRVAPSLPAMGLDDAINSFTAQRNQAINQHWEITSDFDFMLSQLLAQDSVASKSFVRRFRLDPVTAGSPQVTALSRVEDIWADVFPGRELLWDDWKPKVRSSTNPGEVVEYSGNTMSDGEKSALYLASRVFSAPAGVLVVDEPETHLHTLLATRLWDVLEKERPDLRFVYVTHDLGFALSRQDARYVLANPTSGLRILDLDSELPDDVAEVLLGSASLSFYARRIAFIEGAPGSVDDNLYGAWFNGRDTVVRSVGSCEMVMRCATAMTASGVTSSLTAVGLVDRDFHPEDWIASRPADVWTLPFHEVESLLCLPDVVSAVCGHLGRIFDQPSYESSLLAAISQVDRTRVVMERWKNRLEPALIGLIRSLDSKDPGMIEGAVDASSHFEQRTWPFTPGDMLKEEEDRATQATTVLEALKLFPGKALVKVAANATGQSPAAYRDLVVAALKTQEGPLRSLGVSLEAALTPHLPSRRV